MVKGPKVLDKSRVPYAIKQAAKKAPFEFDEQKVAWGAQVVQEFISFWENPTHLDVVKMPDPDDSKSVILFAGDSVEVQMGSAGKLEYQHEPKGRAYQILRTSMLAGFLPLFGLR
jgi:hypothetical protein